MLSCALIDAHLSSVLDLVEGCELLKALKITHHYIYYIYQKVKEALTNLKINRKVVRENNYS